MGNFREYAESINEDSRSSIMGTLGLSSEVADAAIELAERMGVEERHAFLLIKILYLFSRWDLQRRHLPRDAKKIARDSINSSSNWVGRKIADFWLGRGVPDFDGSFPIGGIALLQQNHMPFIRALRMAKTYEEARDAAVQHIIEARRNADDAIITFDDGYYWTIVRDCAAEGISMQHCGDADDTMFSLRSPAHKSHVTVEYYDDDDIPAIAQIAGRQSTFPVQKYYPYIFKFIDTMKIQLIGPKVDDDEFFNVLQNGTAMDLTRPTSDVGVDEFDWKWPIDPRETAEMIAQGRLKPLGIT